MNAISPMIAIGLLSITAAVTAAPDKFLVMDKKHYSNLNQSLISRTDMQLVQQQNSFYIVKMAADQRGALTQDLHRTHHKCGGYSAHDSLQQAQAAVTAAQSTVAAEQIAADYTINNQTTVTPMINQVSAGNIASTISDLSSFTNRYYNTSHGSAAATWIRDTWQTIAASRSDISVDFYNHSGWNQNSVIVTITGNEQPEEVVIVGAHLDSTVGFTQENTVAPGADDDASGIAVITEALRIMVAENFVPAKTIKLMGFAAEEVGLEGSEDIAADYKQNGVDVIGMLQLDMTNYNGSSDDILIYTDYTNSAQNQFLVDLINEYQSISVGYSSCGYGCSDHASFYNQGFTTSFPFEANFGQHNPYIHTSNDTLSNSDSTGANSVPFAKLTLSYLGELANSDGSTPPPPPPPPPGNETTETISDSVARYATDNFGPYVLEAGSNFTVNMTGNNDADLYVRFGSAPTTRNYDCRPYRWGSTESCELTAPAGQPAYIMVRGYSRNTSNYQLEITYTPSN